MRFALHRWQPIVSRLALALCGLALTALGQNQAAADPAVADLDFSIQGEYQGTLALGDRPDVSAGMQIVAQGAGQFATILYLGGLPGAGWKPGDERQRGAGKTADGKTEFAAEKWNATLADGKLTMTATGGKAMGTLSKVDRRSPTLEKEAPAGAVVLFDGKSANAWLGGRMTAEHTLSAGTVSKQSFGDFALHIEFCLPFSPRARGQERGNSGVYLQNRYEVQVLDSFGLAGEINECGAIYRYRPPDVNMCFPPGAWQTYDVLFRAARFDEQHKKIENARVTIEHNGVTIHDRIELEDVTPGGLAKEYPGSGPLLLQYHLAAVTYRNIWVVEKAEGNDDVK
jgi:Domain of Unknown Function (DUF1080)